MKKQLLSAVMLCTLGLAGCGDEAPPAPTPVDPNQKVTNQLEGKTLVMQGENIPSHTNGYSENVNLEGFTQCYNKVVMTVASGNFTVTSTLGTLRDAPGRGDVGTCDNAAAGVELAPLITTSYRIENAREDLSCFDVTFNYPAGFTQEGRGSLSADGRTLKLELFVSQQAIGHRCADGEVGSRTVTFLGEPFTGNAVQTYIAQ
ncbi:hypothetical protein JQX13_11755 [Archangium violaceum]|uniref:hypothetical protein n=1 Tax=Archangium violaceum TaxID=83451 RepID=UPI00193B1F2E|nr:hypothetical protein [Archangium violaceum]QRK10686.1 hypothetical protein JQX13_11755 [Archangium violaceum]